MKKVNSLTPYLTVSIFHFINQFHFLGWELVHTDMPTYLVAGQDIGRGAIPFENQFEPKGPLLYYFYYFLIVLSNSRLELFKILNTLLILLIAFVIIKISKIYNENNLMHITYAGIFILLMSAKGLGQSGYSEIYALFFLSISIYFYLLTKAEKKTYFFTGFFLSLSFLVHPGAGIFLIPISILYIWKKSIDGFIYNSVGFTIPILFISLFYLIKGKFQLLFFSTIQFPLLVTLDSFKGVYLHDFGHYLLQVSEGNQINRIIIIYLILSFIFLMFINGSLNLDLFLFILTSLFFFYNASTYAVHQLIFLAFFASIALVKNKVKVMSYFLVLVTSVSLLFSFYKYVNQSTYNIINLNEIASEYKIKKLSTALVNDFGNDQFTIFALENHLLLFYLNKPNASYIIHPSLSVDRKAIEFIDERLGKEISFEEVLNSKPTYILCNESLLNSIGKNCKLKNYELIEINIDNNIYKVHKLKY